MKKTALLVVVVALAAGSAGGLVVTLAWPASGDKATRSDLDDLSSTVDDLSSRIDDLVPDNDVPGLVSRHILRAV
jgi:hypothetical protein